MNIVFRRAWLALVALLGSAVVSAQPYPNKPIYFVIGFPPGTIVDAVARPVSIEMAKLLGQPIVLDFKPGGNGVIGGRFVINSKPDGHTLFYGNGTSFHPLFFRENPIYAGKDFAPVSRFATIPWYFISSAKVPANTFQQLVAYSNANADSIKFGATAQTTDLLMKMLKDRKGLVSRGIPYKSTGQILAALVVGEVQANIGSIQVFLPSVRAGTINALFIAAPQRSAVLPNVPSAGEVGLPNFEVTTNYGLWAPLATPKDIIQKLSAAAASALKVPAIVEMIHSFGAEPVGSSPEDALAGFESETRFWTEAARISNFQPQ